jgi:hypothetical protein
MSKLIIDEIFEVQQSVLENLSNISIIAISDNQMIEVSADGNRKITNIHINEEMLKVTPLSELESLLELEHAQQGLLKGLHPNQVLKHIHRSDALNKHYALTDLTSKHLI